MAEDENKEIVRRAANALNTADFAALSEVVTGAERWMKGLEEMRTAFPDGRVTIEDLVAEGDKVAERWTFEGTHQGNFMGHPPPVRSLVGRASASIALRAA